MSTITMTKFACPCCGNLTLDQEPPGTFLICPVCYWEDDDVQYRDTHFAGGANKPSLAQARKNYEAFGAADDGSRQHVRNPLPEEIPPA